MAKLTLPAYKLKWQTRFRDNDNFEIGEADLREFALDTADTFGLADTAWNYRGAFVVLTAPDTVLVAKGDVFTYGRGLWQALEAGSVSAAPVAGSQWRQLLAFPEQGYQDGGVFVPDTAQAVKKDWVYTYGVQRWQAQKDMTANAAPVQGANWQKVFDATPLPASVTVPMLAADTVRRLLPAANGVLAWYNSAPLGFYSSLSQAADNVGPGSNGKVMLYQVYGRLGSSTTQQYVSHSATIHLMPGAVLTCSFLPLFYGQESESTLRKIRLTGEGELVGDLWNNGCSQGLHLEVECAKWTGQLRHTGYFSASRTNYWFRGVRINTPAGLVSFVVAYQYSGFYALPAFIWLDTCILTNPDRDISLFKGTQSDGAGANPGDTQTQNIVRLTNTTLYKAAGAQLINQAQGGATLEQDAAGGGGPAPDLSNYVTLTQLETVRSTLTSGPVVTGSYTLQLADKGSVVTVNSSSACSVVLPEDAVAFPVGTILEVSQEGVGQVSISGVAGVTVTGYPGVKTAGQYAIVGLRKMAANAWRVTGGVA